ncbi:unnamed protein product [Mytilus edulis]|uniref:Uncharacterized protein n=1 Tax=Mytilus edulis TaxID=6550 RepID=A0A8S3Q131_MYTED|nr:unnamed protein product [Mytilus edulis]
MEKKKRLGLKFKKTVSLDNSCSMLEKLFDTLVVPITLYGSEVWGVSQVFQDSDPFEHLHIKFILGVQCKTTNVAFDRLKAEESDSSDISLNFGEEDDFKGPPSRKRKSSDYTCMHVQQGTQTKSRSLGTLFENVALTALNTKLYRLLTDVKRKGGKGRKVLLEKPFVIPSHVVRTSSDFANNIKSKVEENLI